MEFERDDLVQCVLADDQGNITRQAEFIAICDPDETVILHGRSTDAAQVRWVDGDDQGMLGKVPRGPLKPVRRSGPAARHINIYVATYRRRVPLSGCTTKAT